MLFGMIPAHKQDQEQAVLNEVSVTTTTISEDGAAVLWSNGYPTEGGDVVDTVLSGTYGTVNWNWEIDPDAFAGLELNSLTLDTDLEVWKSLTIDNLSTDDWWSIKSEAVGFNANVVLTINSFEYSPQPNRTNPVIGADGVGAFTYVASPLDQDAQFLVGDGGEVVFTGAPSAGSHLVQYGEWGWDWWNGGIFAFEAPPSTISSELNLANFESIALPGSAVLSVIFGDNSLSITTDLGTTNFDNVPGMTSAAVQNYCVSPDAVSGLLRVTFITGDSVAEFEAGAITSGGFNIFDSAANIAADFDALSANTSLGAERYIDEIFVMDARDPALKRTAAQILRDAVGLTRVSAVYLDLAVDVADTVADLLALSPTQIAAIKATPLYPYLAVSWNALVAIDGSIHYTVAQSEAIMAAGFKVSAPANDFVRESFADGSSVKYYFDADDALSRIATTSAEGVLDVRYENAPGNFLGIAFAGFDSVFRADGQRSGVTYFDSAGRSVASRSDLANGGFSNYVDGVLVKRRTVGDDGAFEVYTNAPGAFDGVLYSSRDCLFDASGAFAGGTYYGANGQVVASEVFTGNGGFTLTVGAMTQQKMVNADGTIAVAYSGLDGHPPSYQNDFAPGFVQLVHSEDDSDVSGAVKIFGSGLTVSEATGVIGPASAPDDFHFTSHASEIYTFFSGASDDALSFAPGFGSATIKGFAAAPSSDILDLTRLFSSYDDAMSAMSPLNGGGSTLITDAHGDALTLIGVSEASLTKARLGFG